MDNQIIEQAKQKLEELEELLDGTDMTVEDFVSKYGNESEEEETQDGFEAPEESESDAPEASDNSQKRALVIAALKKKTMAE
jgi:hypothetical protein